jgi:hypothetical protein
VLLAAQPERVTPVLQVVQRVIGRHLQGQTGLRSDEGQGGTVTLSPDTNSPVDCLCLAKGLASGQARPARLIQRFGSAVNLNIHLHGLVLDGGCWTVCTAAALMALRRSSKRARHRRRGACAAADPHRPAHEDAQERTLLCSAAKKLSKECTSSAARALGVSWRAPYRTPLLDVATRRTLERMAGDERFQPLFARSGPGPGRRRFR